MVRQSDQDEDTATVRTSPGDRLTDIAKSLVHTRKRVQAMILESSHEHWRPADPGKPPAAAGDADVTLSHAGGMVRIEAKQQISSAPGPAYTFLAGDSGAGKSPLAQQLALEKAIELVVVGLEGHQMYATVRTESAPDRDRFDVDMNISLSGLDAFEATTLKRLLTEKLRALLAAAREENADRRVTQLVQAIAPEDPLADPELQVVESTVELRNEFIERVPVLTSSDVHRNAGFPGGNPSQTVLRWRRSGKIFGIHHGGRDLYPAFQFGLDGRPLPIVAEVLAILRGDPDRIDWDNALWFAGDTGWLDGRSPIECLQSDPEAVKRAAEQEVLRDES